VRLVAFRPWNFRNLRAERVEFDEGVNLVLGANGQGKTNLLEGIAMLGTLCSFRTARLRRIVGPEERAMGLTGEVAARSATLRLEQRIEIGPRVRRELSVNGAAVSAAEYLRVLPLAAMTQEDRILVVGPPQVRRSFLDRLTFHCEPAFYERLVAYRRYLAQRNAALSRGDGGREVEAWERGLARSGAAVVAARRRTVERIRGAFQQTARELGGPGAREVSLEYRGEAWLEDGRDEQWLEKRYLEAYASSRERDRQAGFTVAGPHRHDVVITAAGRAARDYLSTGQIKIVAAALRLTALEIVEAIRGERLPILVDDCEAELDDRALGRLIERAGSGRQLVLTATGSRRGLLARIPARRLFMTAGACTGEPVEEYEHE